MDVQITNAKQETIHSKQQLKPQILPLKTQEPNIISKMELKQHSIQMEISNIKIPPLFNKI